MAGHIAESYEDVHRLLTDAKAYVRPPDGHGTHAFPDPFTPAVLASLEPEVRAIAAAAWREDRAAAPHTIASRVCELVAQRGLVPEPLARQGIEPTALAIAAALELLPQPPEGDGLPAALDEVLRWAPPIPQVSRVDGDGAQVIGDIAAANRDPGRFPQADRFDVSRAPNQHLSFGRGKHYCPGAALAKLQMAVAVQTALAG